MLIGSKNIGVEVKITINETLPGNFFYKKYKNVSP